MTVFLVASCSKDNVEEVQNEEQTVETEVVNGMLDKVSGRSGEGLDLDCIVIDMPFQLVTVRVVLLSILLLLKILKLLLSMNLIMRLILFILLQSLITKVILQRLQILMV